jgi:hypothetical protein
VHNEYDPKRLGLDAPVNPNALTDDTRVVSAGAVANKTAISDAAIAAAKTFVRHRPGVGQTTSWRDVRAHLMDLKLIDGAVSYDALRRRLLETTSMAVYRVRAAPAVDLASDYWMRMRERFVLDFAEALEEERRGDAVVVFADESFVNLMHRRKHTVADADTADVVEMRRAAPSAVVRSGSGTWYAPADGARHDARRFVGGARGGRAAAQLLAVRRPV